MKTKILSTSQLETASIMLKAVAHPLRLEILRQLKQEPLLTVTEIQKRIGAGQSMTSQHLKELKSCRIVASQKEGNIRHYYLENRDVLKLLRCVEDCCRKKK